MKWLITIVGFASLLVSQPLAGEHLSGELWIKKIPPRMLWQIEQKPTGAET